MKKMMKKLIKKIKEHKLFRKFSCLTVVCLLMFYMCSVSVFAAEGDEVAAQSSETESITDVWTAVMDGLMDLVNAAQGVFYSSGSSFTILPDQWVLDNSDVYDFWFASFDFDFDVSLLQDLDSIDLLTWVGGESFTIPFSVSFSDNFCMLESDFFNIFYFYEYESVGFDSPWLIFSGSYIFSSLVVEFPFGSGLTFLGTLAVLGVALSVILLLIYVVISFIRLRG